MDKIKKNLLILITVSLVIRSAGNIFQPALSYMADDLGISQMEATTNLTLYYFCVMLSFLLFGPLCDRFPKQRLLQLSLVGCFLGSLLCGVATEVMSFNVGRMIQAFSAGLALLSSQIWIGDHSDKRTMMGRLAWFSIVVAMAPIFAPMIGGFLADTFSWRYNFYLILLLCLVGLVVTVVWPLQEGSKGKSVEEEKQDLRKQGPKAILHSYARVLMRLPILSFSLCVQVLFLGQSLFMTISSFLFIDELGLNASLLGLLSGLLVVGMLLGRFLTLYLKKRVPGKTLFLINEGLVISSSLVMWLYGLFTGTHTLWEISSMLFVQAAGFSGLVIISTNNVMLVSGADKGTASGLYNFMNQGVSWLGVLLAQTCYGRGLSSMFIFKVMVCLVLVGTIGFALLYLRIYPNYQSQLE